MKKALRFRFGGRKGFTLIEIIGVLAVISILAAMLAPKIFEVIAESRSTRTSAEVQAYGAAVAKWYADMGTLQSLNADGSTYEDIGAFELALMSDLSGAGTNDWGTNWRGPYLSSAPTAGVGNAVSIRTYTTGAEADFDLDGNGTDDTTQTSARVVYLRYTNVPNADFLRIENIVDGGITLSGGAVVGDSGRVEYAGTTMDIYLAHN